jgi:hypothetical protein
MLAEFEHLTAMKKVFRQQPVRQCVVAAIDVSG